MLIFRVPCLSLVLLVGGFEAKTRELFTELPSNKNVCKVVVVVCYPTKRVMSLS